MQENEDGYTYFEYEETSWKYKDEIVNGMPLSKAYKLDDSGNWVDYLTMIRPDGTYNSRHIMFQKDLEAYRSKLRKVEKRKASTINSLELAGQFIGFFNCRFNLDQRLQNALTASGLNKAKFMNEAIKEKLIRDNLLTDQND